VKFYVVNNNYIQWMKAADESVRENKGRPYIGVVLQINGIEYLAPLTSHKPKHDSILDSFPLVFKIKELGNETNKLGMVQLNNMIPVPATERQLLDLSTLDPKYQALINLQQIYLRKHQDQILKKAEKLYHIVAVGQAQGLIQRCCNFSALEAAMGKFVP
jgi:protein AbiQ